MHRQVLLTAICTAVTIVTASAQDFFTGIDMSYVNELEDCGAVYKDANDQQGDPYDILSDQGANLVRLRLWHNPDWTNYQNFEDVKKSISRSKSAGMQVLLDFHYSDFWADPGRQWRPAAWENITSETILGDSVYQYTLRVLQDLDQLDLLPDFVQVGNEINGNIMVPRNGAAIDSGSPGLYPVNWSRQARLLNRGLDAIAEINKLDGNNIRSIIHVANPLDATSWFRNTTSNGLTNFDIIGLSYYPQWHALGVRAVGQTVANLKSEFGKDVMIIETGYPWTNNSASDNANNVLGFDGRLFTYSGTFSVETQRAFLTELCWLVKDHGGLGVIYWEPAWISTSCQTYWGTGSHWENAALFDLDGKLHEGSGFLSYDYTAQPAGLADHAVTFIVDMTGVNTDNGVFVTGTFTGTDWSFLEMDAKGDNLYELQVNIPGRTEGGFIFYNDDDWAAANKETVPAACAQMWNTHRKYTIRDEPLTYHFGWASCDQQSNVPIELRVQGESSGFLIYPTMSGDVIYLKTDFEVQSVGVVGLGGEKFNLPNPDLDTLQVGHLRSGTYLLRIVSSKGDEFFAKFIRE